MADQIRLPSSGGGLVRYSEEYGSRIKIKPIQVIAIIFGVIIIEILLRIFL